MSKITVTNRQPRLLTVMLAPRPQKDAEGKVVNGEDGKPKMERVGPTLRLVPGANEVDSKLLDRAMEHPQLKQWMRLRWVTVARVAVTKSEAGNEGGAPASDLKGMNAREAVAHAKAAVDRELLARWLDAEDRSTVTKAIADRIAELDEEAGNEGGEGEGSDEDDDDTEE